MADARLTTGGLLADAHLAFAAEHEVEALAPVENRDAPVARRLAGCQHHHGAEGIYDALEMLRTHRHDFGLRRLRRHVGDRVHGAVLEAHAGHHAPRAGLHLEGVGRGLRQLVGYGTDCSDVARPADGAEQHRQAGGALERIGLAFGFGLEGERADAKAVEGNFVFGLEVGGPGRRLGLRGGRRGQRAECEARGPQHLGHAREACELTRHRHPLHDCPRHNRKQQHRHAIPTR